MKEREIIRKAAQLYDEYNRHKLFYDGGDRYDKLITPIPFHITEENYKLISKKGDDIIDWLQAQKELIGEVKRSRSLRWLRTILENDLGKKTLKYQFEYANLPLRTPRITRADLSGLPFGCHEIQSRWASLGYLHYLPLIFDKVIPIQENEISTSQGMMPSIRKLVDHYCQEDNEICIFIAPKKYSVEIDFALRDEHDIVHLAPDEFNESNLKISKGKLTLKKTGQIVRLVFRRELTLKTLLSSSFGEKVVKLNLKGEVFFEPELDMANDMKIGMALVFDPRTSHFFPPTSKKLFLRTSLLDPKLQSYNLVFSKNFESLDEFVKKTTKSNRRLVLKYAGADLRLSFGGRGVFRMDKNNPRRIIQENYDPNDIWILQELDNTRYPVTFVAGDYSKPETCKVVTQNNFAPRIKAFYYNDKNESKVIDITANMVNDHWKARSKISDQKAGLGTVTTPVRVLKSNGRRENA